MSDLGEIRPGETPLEPEARVGLKLPIGTRRELSDAEFRNIAKAFAKYLAARPSTKTAPFTWIWFLQLHGEMFSDVWEWAGRRRAHDVRPVGVDPVRIETELLKLQNDLRVWAGSEPDPLVVSARLHYRAICIHPFSNGNGRWARLLANIWLKQQRAPIVEWPEPAFESGDSVIRAEYLAALKAWDESGAETPLIELHRRHGGNS